MPLTRHRALVLRIAPLRVSPLRASIDFRGRRAVADWQVGDLAVCVNTDVIECEALLHVGSDAIREGMAVRVTRAALAPCGCVELHWDGAPEYGGLAERFRKVRP